MTNEGLCIVTGATGSIGKEIARALALRGSNIVLACRNTSRAEELRSELLAMPGCGEVTVAKVSLDSLDSIRDFCNHIKALNRPIAAILHNAGVMCRHRSVTADGFEQSLAVNYLAPVLITHLLLPLVAEGGCIAFTTSITRKLHTLSEKILHEPAAKFSQLGTYGRTKLALTHYALWLSEELRPRNIRVNCADPGVVDTNMITMQRWYDSLANVIARPFMSRPATGASSMLSAYGSDLTGMIFKHTHKPHSMAADLRRSDAPHRPAFVAATHRLLRLS
ncbi:MAG: SDR family NAD(P)-dependent oxidoreductase [Muribaculaceae bacterium]